jgi:hypothetical protein
MEMQFILPAGHSILEAMNGSQNHNTVAIIGSQIDKRNKGGKKDRDAY